MGNAPSSSEYFQLWLNAPEVRACRGKNRREERSLPMVEMTRGGEGLTRKEAQYHQHTNSFLMKDKAGWLDSEMAK